MSLYICYEPEKACELSFETVKNAMKYALNCPELSKDGRKLRIIKCHSEIFEVIKKTQYEIKFKPETDEKNNG